MHISLHPLTEIAKIPAMFTHQFPFDPTYGYTQEQLLQIAPPAIPDGYEQFWQQTYQAALAQPPRPTLRKINSDRPGLEVFELEYDGLDGFRVGVWLTRPEGQTPRRGVVFGHGYGGRQAPDLDVPGPACVAVFPCARGFHRSARPDLPNNSTEHVIFGIESPETYIHRYCVADLFCAVSALLQIAPETAGCIDYIGGSFGGGIGAMTIPWEKRFRRALLRVPSFGHHDLRLTMQCVGSGESVRNLFKQKPAIRKTLALHDAAVSAQFCRIPTMVACALFDPAVPPPGQFAVYNALAGEKKLYVRPADHFQWEGDAEDGARLSEEAAKWFCVDGRC